MSDKKIIENSALLLAFFAECRKRGVYVADAEFLLVLAGGVKSEGV